MHRVEIRLTQAGDAPQSTFEVYNETLKDGKYVELSPMRVVASDGPPIVLFLEGDERVVVVAKADTGQMVYNKEQNANVRVPTEAEEKDRLAREENLKKAQAQQEVRNAQANVGQTKELSEKSTHEAETALRKTEAKHAESLQTKPASPVSPSTNPAPSPARPGAPASANTGPVDSKQVKQEGSATPVKASG